MQPRHSIRIKLFLSILLTIIVSFSIISVTALLSFNISLKEMLLQELPGNFNRFRWDILRNILSVTLPGLFLSFGLAYLVARRFTGALKALALGVEQIEKGEPAHRLEVNDSDEFGMLAESFNRMAGALDERDSIIKGKGEEIEALNVRLQRMNELLGKNILEKTSGQRIEMGRLETILTSMVEGVLVTDSENRVLLFNLAAQRIFNLVPHRVKAQPIEYLCEMGGFHALLKYIREFRTGGGTVSGCQVEIETRGKKLKANMLPFRDEAGAFAGLVMSFRDITVEEETDRMKTEFISTVSHELKTPLTSIKGSLQFIMAKAKWLTVTERELLSICLRNTNRLIRLINDILDISKIEAGRMELVFHPLSVSKLVIYAVEEIKGFAMSRNITLINNIDAGMPLIYGDHDRLIQVLSNLLSNAIKFSPAGKAVTLAARLEGDYLLVSVADRGKMIRLADREKLFKKFQQLESTGSGDGGGTGLGLAICKEIMEWHHGHIYYEEGAAGGNVFTFTVPICTERQKQSPTVET
jgi:PAS domain S-box-containing protein